MALESRQTIDEAKYELPHILGVFDGLQRAVDGRFAALGGGLVADFVRSLAEVAEELVSDAGCGWATYGGLCSLHCKLRLGCPLRCGAGGSEDPPLRHIRL